MFLLHVPSVPYYVMPVEHKLGYSVEISYNSPKVYFCFFPVLFYTEVFVGLPVLQLPTSTGCIITVSYLPDFIYLPSSVFTESDKSCNLNTYVVWFYVVSKGNGFGLIKSAV